MDTQTYAHLSSATKLSLDAKSSTGWKTNYSQGAKPAPAEISKEFEEIAIKSAKAVGCKIAGVDILEGPDGPRIVDVNSQPGWKGLQVVAKVNIAEEIVNFVLDRTQKIIYLPERILV